MRNITVSIDDKVYHDVRVWCAERETSVSRVVQMFLEDLSPGQGLRMSARPKQEIAPALRDQHPPRRTSR